MIHGKRLVVVLPAYNAARTLQKTFEELPHEIIDDVILVDDASGDETAQMARKLGIRTFIHPKNRGYGGNQKTCYREALQCGADIVIMVHPDYQYTPALVTAMSSLIGKGVYDAVLGSRMLGTSALKGGMPRYKYASNRVLTFVQNVMTGRKLSEYHTGYRAFTRQILETLPLEENSDDYVFDNEMLAQVIAFGFSIGEVSCPTKYFPEASSISFLRSVRYGLGVLSVCMMYRLQKWSLRSYRIFDPKGRRIEIEPVSSTTPAITTVSESTA